MGALWDMVRGLVDSWIATFAPTQSPISPEFALQEARKAGWIGPRTQVEMVEIYPRQQRLRFTTPFEKPLGIELLLRERDSELGPPDRRVPLSESVQPFWRAWAREPGLAASLLGADVCEAMAELHSGVRGLHIDDLGVRFEIEDFSRMQPVLGAASRLLELIETGRRALPKSDHAIAVARVWREVARSRQAAFDEGDERLALTTPSATLDVYVARWVRVWCTFGELTFAQPLHEVFELSKDAGVGMRKWLMRRLVIDSKRGHVVYIHGSRAAALEVVTSNVKPALSDALELADAFRLSERGFSIRIDSVLADASDLEQLIDRMLALAAALEPGSKRAQGPYR